MVLLGDAAGRLSLASYGSREGPSKPIVRNLGVVRFGRDGSATALELTHCHLVIQTSPASTLSYLDNGHVFVGSQCGDCQIIRLQVDKISQGKGKRKATDLKQIEEEDAGEAENTRGFTTVGMWANIAPVLDFCVVEGEGGGSVSSTFECASLDHETEIWVSAHYRLKS